MICACGHEAIDHSPVTIDGHIPGEPGGYISLSGSCGRCACPRFGSQRIQRIFSVFELDRFIATITEDQLRTILPSQFPTKKGEGSRSERPC